MAGWLQRCYCNAGSFARVPPSLDNPDQRIANDTELWAEQLGRLAPIFAAAPLKVLPYGHVSGLGSARCASPEVPFLALFEAWVEGASSAAPNACNVDYAHIPMVCVVRKERRCLPQVVFYTHWMLQLTSVPAVGTVYLFFSLSSLLQW